MEPKRQFLVTHCKKREQLGILSALLEDDTVMELSIEPKETPSLLGNIYIGKVQNLAPQLEAAFVEILPGQICYYSLQEDPKPLVLNRRHKDAKKPLVEGDEILVQVSREALKSKFPAVTSNLNFPGKYLVLTSQHATLGISSKLPQEERNRLRELLAPFVDGSFGLIARTNAAGVEASVLRAELARLKETYTQILEKAKSRTCYSLLSRTEPAFLSSLRQIPKDSLSGILTDDKKLYDDIQAYLRDAQPEDLNKLTLYQDRLLPLTKCYSLEKALEDGLRERVWLKSGGYLVIQPTEALTVVDVNTGKYEGGKKKQQTFRKINQEAARETARQLRLRNLSGIILIDFIDMEKKEDRLELLELLAGELKKDPIKAVLVDMTKLNLVELTRKKARKSLAEQWEDLGNGCKTQDSLLK